ncbi:MAG: hypothetical protein Q9227_008244 [Pyrenula ochraceoflavens]
MKVQNQLLTLELLLCALVSTTSIGSRDDLSGESSTGSISNSDSGSGPDSSNNDDPSPTDAPSSENNSNDPLDLDTSALNTDEPATSTEADTSTSTDTQTQSESTISSTPDSSSTTPMPTTIVTSTATPSPSINGTTSNEPWQNSSDGSGGKNSLTFAPGGIIAVSVLGAFALGTAAFIAWRVLSSKRRKKALLSKRVSTLKSFATDESAATVPLFTEASPRSSEAFSPTASPSRSTSLPSLAMGMNKPLPASPDTPQRKSGRFLAKGKRPIYAPAASRLSMSSASRPSPLRRQFSLDLEEEANMEVMQNVGLSPPTPTVNRHTPLTSNPVRAEDFGQGRSSGEMRQWNRNNFPDSLRTGNNRGRQRFQLD